VISGTVREPRQCALASQPPVAQLVNVWKTFGDSDVAVRALSLTVAEGEFVSLLGPSGCGKTTTLRMLAGFMSPTRGSIHIAGRDMAAVAPRNRNIGIVFQHYALFPHLTVEDNIAFGLRIRHQGNDEIAARVREYVQLVRLQGLEQRKPSQLSGGQQQRVALARALITQPRLILLDEPLGALDRKLREDMQIELKQLLRRVGITAIFVTHDQDEALTMSDRVAVMNRGVLEQVAGPRQLYERPRTPFVAGFVGTSTMFSGTLERQVDGRVALMAAAGRLLLAPGTVWRPGTVVAAIRPEKVSLTAGRQAGDSQVSGSIESVRYVGESTQYRLRLRSGEVVIAHVLNAGAVHEQAPGEDVTVSLPAQHLHVLEDPANPVSGPATS
jgi:spermidine/putrescine transport system ATP-binding protein